MDARDVLVRDHSQQAADPRRVRLLLGILAPEAIGMTIPSAEFLGDVDPLGLAERAGALGAAVALRQGAAPDPGGQGAADLRPAAPLIDWVPTGALGGWGGDPFWPSDAP